MFGTFIGIKVPLLNWTNEIAPIKQSGAIALTLFGGWGLCLILGAVYFLIGYRLGAALYLLLWTVLYAALSALLLRWMNTRGADAFAAL